MAYEGQIAGVGDRIPGRPLRSAAIRAMQSQSERDIHSRLPGIVAAVREVADRDGGLEFVNGGGTGSLARTAAAGIVTELTAGLGLLRPGAVRQLPLARARAGGVLLPPRGPAARGWGRHAARRRLPRLRSGDRRPAARALPARRPALRPPGGRRRGPEPAARRRRVRAPGRRPRLPAPREGGRAVRALRPALPGRGTRGSSTRSRPTAARARRSSERDFSRSGGARRASLVRADRVAHLLLPALPVAVEVAVLELDSGPLRRPRRRTGPRPRSSARDRSPAPSSC